MLARELSISLIWEMATCLTVIGEIGKHRNLYENG
jgi:hypothetical protein